MDSKTGMAWGLAGLLAAACMLLGSGCGDDEDEEAGGGPIVTNIVQQPGGGPIIVTNPPDDDNPPLQVPDDDPRPPFQMLAPQLVSPANGTSIFVPSDVQNDLTFSWTAASGATYYVIQVDGSRKDTDATSTIMTVVGLGSHSWSVRAMDNEGNERPSSTFSFTTRRAFSR